MIEKIGIIGAGQMGQGIAQVCAMKGLQVQLNDANRDAIEGAITKITKRLRQMEAKGKISKEDRQHIFGNIHQTADLSQMGECDLVIEAVVEDEGVKYDVLNRLCGYIKPETIIASNTSSISITRLASVTDRPDRFIGMHFMNPVPVMKLVELIRGMATSDATFQTIRTFTKQLGKTPAVARDYPAFIVNRILLPMINEAIFTLHEGVGTIQSIDTAMKLGTNHPMGPLELADFIGLDTCLAVMNVLYYGFNDSKYRPCPLLVKYVEAGWLGRKSGRGFYDYGGQNAQAADAGAAA